MKGKMPWKIALSFLALTLAVTGCWSNREVEDLAIMTLVGIDRITENEADKWQVSSRIFTPKPELQKGEGAKQSTEILVKGTGDTIQAADFDFFKRIPRFPFYGHLNSIIIGERAAKEKMEEILSIHMVHVEDRPRTFLLVTQEEALDILGAEPEMAANISKEITSIVEEKAKKFGTSMGVTSAEFTECLLSKDRDPVLPRISLKYPEKREKSVPETIAVEGFAVFRGPTLVGWLNQEETTGFLFLCQKNIKDASIIIPVQDGQRQFTYNVNTSKNKIKPKMENGKLTFTVTIQVKGAILETGGIEITSENLKKETDRINERIQEMCMNTITKAKQLNSDYLGYMQKFHRVNPKEWQAVKENWREAFQKAEIEVSVDSTILNTGRIIKRLDLEE